MSSRVLVLGLGVAGRAALEALARREIDALAVDDAPGDEARACARSEEHTSELQSP